MREWRCSRWLTKKLGGSLPTFRRSGVVSAGGWYFAMGRWSPATRVGAVRLSPELRLTRPIGRLLGALRLSPLVDALDVGLSRTRQHLGRFVPEGPALRRYP